jgi:hypothetical protein
VKAVTTDNLFHALERGEIYEEVMLASTAPAMIRRLQRLEQAQRIEEILEGDCDLQVRCIERASALYADATPGAVCQNEHDLALCGYLYVLRDVRLRAMTDFITLVMRERRSDLPATLRLLPHLLADAVNAGISSGKLD